ncbi:tRNA (cytidine(34)-2'-O)-methyltransferase [Akkermansiaceae bacterium]|nr:tRNA (cytidine(34)-2'-O)-methyltransferase [Akkermansiaceae bacterium]
MGLLRVAFRRLEIAMKAIFLLFLLLTLIPFKAATLTTNEIFVRRAGLDYWKDVDLKVWESFEELLAAQPNARLWFLSTKGKKSAWSVEFQPNDFLVFGPETRGLPEAWLDDRAIRIPMKGDSTRSLNLATAVAIILYEAERQIGDLA